MSKTDGSAGQPDPRAQTEVFISYSSQDRDKVEAIADAFIKAGFKVWWDRDLLPGDSYENSIEVALKSAKAVIVCWSQAATQSEWVRSEADDARLQGKMCPVFIEECHLPKPFDRVHTENLIGWRGNRDHHAFQELEEAVRARVEGRVAKKIPWRRKWLTRGALVSVIAMAGVAAANVQLIRDIFFPQDTVTSDEVEDLVAKALAQALTNGVDLDERGQAGLRDALTSILASSNADKAVARQALAAGRVDDAANSLAEVAQRQAAAAGDAAEAAAQTWREAGALYSASDTAKAVNAFEEALRLSPNDPDAANGLAGLYERVGRMDEAQALYESILDKKGRSDPVWEAKALGNLGLLAVSRGDWRTADENVRQAMAIFETQGDQESVAKALVNLGQINQEIGDLAASRRYSKRGLALSKQLGMPKGEATALANLGYADMIDDDFEAARDYFAQAEAIMEAEDMNAELGILYINLTRMLSIEDKNDEAEAMARKALVVAHKMDARIVEAGAYNHLGNISRDRGDFEEADRYQRIAIRIFDEIDNPRQLAREYRSWAMTAAAQGDLDAAIERYAAGLDVLNTIEAPVDQGKMLLALARTTAQNGDLATAVTYLDQAQPKFEQADALSSLGDMMEVRARIFRAENRMQEAVDAFAIASDYYKADGHPLWAAQSLMEVAAIGRSAGEAGVATSAIDEAFRLFPDDTPIEILAQAAVGRAEAALMRNDAAAALAAGEAFIAQADAESDPWQRANARLLKARIDRAIGNAEASRAGFTEAAAILSEAGGELADLVADVERERDQ